MILHMIILKWVIARSGLMALWPHITKFGSWSVAKHVTIFATEVDKHNPVYCHKFHQWDTV